MRKDISSIIANIEKIRPGITSKDTAYNNDKTPVISGNSLFTVIPENANELSKVLEIISSAEIPVFARGSGTGVVGGSIPMGGTVISFEKMNRIIEIDENNLTITVEPGVITSEIHKAAAEKKLFYPPDPASLNDCSIGGNVAAGAGGPHAVKYGTTKDYILGMKFLTVDGTPIHWGGKTVKNSSGYSFAQLIAGSEGTLGLITELTLRLLPLPEHSCDILASFSSMHDAVSCVNKIILAKIQPSAIEFVDKSALSFVKRHFPEELIFPEAGAVLIISIDSSDEVSLEKNFSTLKELLSNNSDGFTRADDEASKEKIWNSRRKIRPSIEKESPIFFAEDPAVPRSEIASFIDRTDSAIRKHGTQGVFFGHAGDGNLHINILKGEIADDEWERMKPLIRREIYSEALSCGGVISGEHGIGYTRKDYLKMMYSEEEINLMKKIKQAFDPKNLLNPHKIF